jgi:hypothetical protein
MTAVIDVHVFVDISDVLFALILPGSKASTASTAEVSAALASPDGAVVLGTIWRTMTGLEVSAQVCQTPKSTVVAFLLRAAEFSLVDKNVSDHYLCLTAWKLVTWRRRT